MPDLSRRHRSRILHENTCFSHMLITPARTELPKTCGLTFINQSFHKNLNCLINCKTQKFDQHKNGLLLLHSLLGIPCHNPPQYQCSSSLKSQGIVPTAKLNMSQDPSFFTIHNPTRNPFVSAVRGRRITVKPMFVGVPRYEKVLIC